MDADEESTFYRDLENLNISENGVTRTVTRKTVINKYQEVWNEFYDWEQSECLHIIESISLEAHSEADGEAHPHSQRRPLRSDYEFTLPDLPTSRPSDIGLYDTMRITVYTAGNGRKRMTDDVDIFLAQELEPLSSYEACTPSTVSIGSAWYTTNEDETILFEPFADDPKFDFWEFAGEFGWFDWLVHEMCEGSKIDIRDPDSKCNDWRRRSFQQPLT